jgi:hypothetical protein
LEKTKITWEEYLKIQAEGKLEKMKGNLIDIWPTFRKSTPEMPKYNATIEPEEQLGLVHKSWEVLTY